VTKKQRENSAKYLYDMSKGIALLSVVGNLLKEKWDILNIFVGGITSILFYVWAYILDGGDKSE
jgi:hypothetical protein